MLLLVAVSLLPITQESITVVEGSLAKTDGAFVRGTGLPSYDYSPLPLAKMDAPLVQSMHEVSRPSPSITDPQPDHFHDDTANQAGEAGAAPKQQPPPPQQEAFMAVAPPEGSPESAVLARRRPLAVLALTLALFSVPIALLARRWASPHASAWPGSRWASPLASVGLSPVGSSPDVDEISYVEFGARPRGGLASTL